MSSSIVALVDSGATHSFVAQELVQKYQLPVTMDDGMKVTLADGSLVTSSTLCQVPLVACTDKGKAVAFGVYCCVLPNLNHDVVSGVDWLLPPTQPLIGKRVQ